MTPDGQPARIGPLLWRLQEGEAETVEELDVLVSHAVVAGMEDAELRALGLPPRAGIAIELRSSGNIADANFEIKYLLLHPDGRPVVSFGREGALLTIGGRETVLPLALFRAMDAVDYFQSVRPERTEDRMRAWAAIRELLPENARLDPFLSGLKIFQPSCISLQPFLNSSGEPDFDPVFGISSFEEGLEGNREITKEMNEVLPHGAAERLSSTFRRLSIREAYSVDGGWFVVLPPALHKALGAVKRFQNESAEVRRSFIENPRGYLREALEGEVGEEVLESLFFEEGYSERVREIGIWKKKVVPWLGRQETEWLPPETVGLQIGDEVVALGTAELPDVEEKLEKAIVSGKSSIWVGEQQIPATSESLDAVRLLIQQVGREGDVDHNVAQKASDSTEKVRLSLIVVDNLDEIRYQERTRRVQEVGERIPSNLGTRLLPHQLKALYWLQDNWSIGNRGVLLADDMGLGKTLSALSFMTWLRDQHKEGRTSRKPLLVVAPTGLLKNWLDEHDLHLKRPGLGYLCEAFGARLRELKVSDGADGEHGMPVLNVGLLKDSDWVLTTYETLRDYQLSFGRVNWGCMVLDEAQKIKNPSAALTDAVQGMKVDFSIAMTGTPVENRLSDLWTVADSVRPGLLGSLKGFVAKFERDGSDEKIKELKEALTEVEPPPFMLRRLKEDHLEGLPEREIHLEKITMPALQAQRYTSWVEKARGSSNRGGMLEVLQALRRVSVDPIGVGDSEGDDHWIGSSARLKGLIERLDRIRAGGEKALVFIEYRDIQGMLAEVLQRRYRLRHPVMVINGILSGEKRKQAVDRFQERSGFDVMLLSPKAGGVGLTVTAANHVLHLSRWWNPAVEDQCNDRVYRIGQERKVHVHHFLAVHPDFGDRSFDIKLDELLERKRELSRQLLASPSVSETELDDLFKATIGLK